MSRRIYNLSDLSDHVGASCPTVESIGRRLYKDTECGVSFGVAMVSGGTTARTFSALFAPSVIGWRCISWREAHGVRQSWGTMPQALREYLQCEEGTTIGYDPRTIQESAIVRRSVVLGCVRLTVTINVPKPSRPGVSVAGYAEGSDGQPCPHLLAFPFSPDAFDAAVSEADADGCALFEEANDSGFDPDLEHDLDRDYREER